MINQLRWDYIPWENKTWVDSGGYQKKPLPSIEQLFDITVKEPAVIGVFGVNAVDASILFYHLNKHKIKYVVTTESVMNNAKFKLAKDFVDYLVNTHNLTLITIPDEISRETARRLIIQFSNIFSQYSMHITGIPMMILSIIAPVGFGQKWLYDPAKNKFIIL